MTNYEFVKEISYDSLASARTDLEGRCYEPYLASDGLVKAVNLAINLGRPLLIEGEPGAGKTRLAAAIAYQLTQNNLADEKDEQGRPLWWPFYTWSVKSYSKARDGLYVFDGIGRLRDAQMLGTDLQSYLNPEQRAKILDRLQNPEKYCKPGALGKAIQEKGQRAVVLIDEIDKADSDFANDLLLELDEFRFDIPEIERTERLESQNDRPIVILTSNSERPLPDAFLRRCLYFNIEFPDKELLKEIVTKQQDQKIQQELDFIDNTIDIFLRVREATKQPGIRPPGTSEFLEFVRAIHLLRQRSPEELDDALADLTTNLPLLGTLLKTKKDQAAYARRGS
jgi:MoxR-like ATPase